MGSSDKWSKLVIQHAQGSMRYIAESRTTTAAPTVLRK